MSMKSNQIPVQTDPQNQRNALVISANKLAPEQKKFNQLLEKINRSSSAIEQLKLLGDTYRPQRNMKIAPLLALRCAADEKLALFLENRLQTPKGLSKKQQDDVAELAFTAAQQVMYGGSISAQLEAALDRLQERERKIYGDLSDDDIENEDDFENIASSDPNAAFSAASNFSNEWHQNPDSLNELVERLLGPEFVGDPRFSSYESVIEAVMQRQQSGQTSFNTRFTGGKKPKPSKKAEQENADADLALKTVYRKLASALHPDKEPDPTERQRKTVLMVRVNTANDKKDLLALLRLQLEIEQINPESIAALAAEKLRPYNKVLKEQLETLNDEQRHLENQLRHEFNLGYSVANSKNLQAAIRHQVSALRLHVEQVNDALSFIQTDKNLKLWVRNQIRAAEADF